MELYRLRNGFQASRLGSFRKLGVPYFGVLIIRIRLFRVLYQDPLFLETPNLVSGASVFLDCWGFEVSAFGAIWGRFEGVVQGLLGFQLCLF